MSAFIGALLILLGFGCEIATGAQGEVKDMRLTPPPNWVQFLPLIGLLLIIGGLLLVVEWWVNA